MSASILPQENRNDNFFISTGSMDSLTMKHNHMINPPKHNGIYYVIILKCKICFITIARANFTQRYILHIPTATYIWLDYKKNTACSSISFLWLRIIQWMWIIRVIHLILYVHSRNYYKNPTSSSSYISTLLYKTTYNWFHPKMSNLLSLPGTQQK